MSKVDEVGTVTAQATAGTADKSTGIIEIAKSDFIGEGSHRACYAHPENKDRCIKVGALNSKESRRERACYKLLQKRGVTWDSLSQFYGFVETNMGPGEEFDLVRDHDGEISKTLEHYLETDSDSERSELYYQSLKKAFSFLKSDIYDQVILVRTILTENILYKKINEDEGRLVIIDNIGNTDLLPICDYSKFFARRKITRKWQRFERSMLKQYGKNERLRNVFFG